MEITHQQTLLYYDCELIFEASDDAGRHFVAVHHDDHPDGCEYAVIQAEPENIAKVKDGRLDLLSLMLDSPGGEWYTTNIGIATDEIVLDKQPTPVSECGSLPKEGYYVVTNNPENPESSDGSD